MPYFGSFGLEFQKTIKFVKNESLTHTLNFGIASAFSKAPGSDFSEGPGPVPVPGPLYKVCRYVG